MGTRRSRHNRGRKPLYKEHRFGLPKIGQWKKLRGLDRPEQYEIGRQRYIGGAFYSTRTWWTDAEKDALGRFISGGYGPSESAEALGRTESSIANYARDHGLILPAEWKKLIAPRNRTTSPPQIALAYPYIVTGRPSHSDLLAINALVPHTYPEHMRADICQEMLLAVFEDRITIDEIKSHRQEAAWFLKKFWRDNYEDAGRAVSFSMLEDDERSYDEIASSLAAKEWHENQLRDSRSAYSALRSFTAPDQLDAAWRAQVGRWQASAYEQGQFLSFDEAAEELDGDRAMAAALSQGAR